MSRCLRECEMRGEAKSSVRPPFNASGRQSLPYMGIGDSETAPNCKVWATVATAGHDKASDAIPEFAKVYHFIGTLIDPDINSTMGMYLQKLKEMDPITAKTINWLSTYDPETKTIGSAMETSALTNVMYPPYQVPHDAHYLPPP